MPRTKVSVVLSGVNPKRIYISSHYPGRLTHFHQVPLRFRDQEKPEGVRCLDQTRTRPVALELRRWIPPSGPPGGEGDVLVETAGDATGRRARLARDPRLGGPLRAGRDAEG